MVPAAQESDCPFVHQVNQSVFTGDAPAPATFQYAKTQRFRFTNPAERIGENGQGQCFDFVGVFRLVLEPPGLVGEESRFEDWTEFFHWPARNSSRVSGTGSSSSAAKR